MSSSKFCQICPVFDFIILDICLALTTALAKKKNYSHCSGHNFGKSKLKSLLNADLWCDF